MSQVLPASTALPLGRSLLTRMAVLLAFPISRLSPRRLRALLGVLRRGASPATAEQAGAARRDVVATSVRCAGKYCLPRSLATVLLCRVRGTWPTWCTGVRTPPFSAHAWIAVDGTPIDEPADTVAYHVMLSVPPLPR
jgi:hypothetical protein